MIHEIEAKKILSHSKKPDPYFGIKYNMNIYRGCQHRCIYCDSRSECYQIENFDDLLVKVNAVDLLQDELPRKRVKGTIGTGSMSDPYTYIEHKYQLTRRSLEVIAQQHFPVHIITKSNMVERDVDLLQEINRTYAAVSFTITTTDDELAKKIEPGAPVPSKRLQAMKRLADAGVYVGVTMMPILPFITDTAQNIQKIIQMAREHGAQYILPWFGVTLRDRQRQYFYQQLDRLFPSVKGQYQKMFGNNYGCNSKRAKYLKEIFKKSCEEYGLQPYMNMYSETQPTQLKLF